MAKTDYHMRDSDIALYALNTLALMVSWTFEIEAFLRIMLLIITILYTSFKVYDNVRERKNGKNEKDN